MWLEKYSFGIGDRFGRQGKPLLQAVAGAKRHGIDITPVWNKSQREHNIVKSRPADVRRQAEAAVTELGWTGPYYVDADHITLQNVDTHIEASDFFTLDVADFIGRAVNEIEIGNFVSRYKRYAGSVALPRHDRPLRLEKDSIEAAGRKFLAAIRQAGRIYRHIEQAKGRGNFITEISMDETGRPQSPAEMLLILAEIGREQIPVQTIAPRFTGRFNKGVDYSGNAGVFGREFETNLAVIEFAVNEFGLPANLKLSVHSGSDKFSIYPAINAALRKFDAGVHIKTAGTTWLEELIGLALAGNQPLHIVRDIYRQAFERLDELCRPYTAVLDIHRENLPPVNTVARWSGEEFAAALRHNPTNSSYNPDFRQLLHVAYKIAAELGDVYYQALETHQDVIGPNVTDNIYNRHIQPLLIRGCG